MDPALLLPYLANGDDPAEAGLAAAATDQRTVGDTWARQLEYAPVLAVVDKEEADEEDHALPTQLHPTARQARAGSKDLARLAFASFDVEAAAAAQHPACALLPQEADEAGVSTLVWHRRRPFHPERLYQALEDLCCAAARSRGWFWLADRPDTLLAWDAAGGALCVENVARGAVAATTARPGVLRQRPAGTSAGVLVGAGLPAGYSSSTVLPRVRSFAASP